MSITHKGQVIARIVVEKTSIHIKGSLYFCWEEDLTGVKKLLKRPDDFKVWYDVFIEKIFGTKCLYIFDENFEQELNSECFRKLLIYYFTKISSSKDLKQMNEKTETEDKKVSAEAEMTRLERMRDYWETQRKAHNCRNALSVRIDNKSNLVYFLTIYKEKDIYFAWIEVINADNNNNTANQVLLLGSAINTSNLSDVIKVGHIPFSDNAETIFIDDSIKKHIMITSIVHLQTMENQISKRDMLLAQCKY